MLNVDIGMLVTCVSDNAIVYRVRLRLQELWLEPQ